MTNQSKKTVKRVLPVPPVAKLTRPFLKFLEIEASGGILLLLCTLVALFLANSSYADQYFHFWHTPISFSFGEFTFSHSLGHLINDGLMTIFFFVVGLEIKREVISGELKDPRAAMLPGLAALGGMIAPALIYLFVLKDNPGHSGWGIPMATDIAFVVGFMSLLGARVPHGLKIFILSLAIADDLGAVIVIALFYSKGISMGALALSLAGFLVVTLLNRIGVRQVPIYVFVGVLIWFAVLVSGVHPTIAGVLLGLLTPASAWIGEQSLSETLSGILSDNKINSHQMKEIVTVAKESVSPLERLEFALHPWVAFFIMPLFALSNAGVVFDSSILASPISLSVMSGLALGKPIGIFLFSFLAVKLLGAKLPTGVNWKVMLGAGSLAGIGFTMSIFIAGLALPPELLDSGKIGTLAGTTVSTFLGLLMLYVFLPKRKTF